MAEDKVADLKQVLELLPHRYPFLLVDRVLELEKGRVVTIKNVTFNEPFFQGHFPGRPVMLGVLLVEAMEQSAAFIVLSRWGRDGNLFMLNSTRSLSPPGRSAIRSNEVKTIKFHRPLWRMSAEARVDGELAAEAELSAMEVEEKVR